MNPCSNRVSPYPLRMPPEIRSWYESEAGRNDRSLNSEILKILKDRMNRVKGQRTNEE
ncbi:Arc-like DNA binding domain [Yersinia frederiksenii]|nr:Arc-like DNA binding domain [Yersinia frederiksenii]